jgi:hypothetical protein
LASSTAADRGDVVLVVEEEPGALAQVETP